MADSNTETERVAASNFPTQPSVQQLATMAAATQAPLAERMAWLALALTPGLGQLRVARAVAKMGSAERILTLPLTELEALNLPAASAQSIHSGASMAEAEKEYKRVSEAGGSLITPADAAYPERLREIFDPPVVLWLRGDASLLAWPGIAIVGTRQPTPYGAGMAQMLARDLAAHGLVVLSGMARGVDTAAHRGALEAGGKTIAVWGTGIDVIYPKENKRLAEQILESGGTILSEYAMGTFPAPQNFPIRNRILSGMSVGVLVIEAGENSGTRITARCALEQNREVFAVPGNVTTKNAWGPNTLIKQGAKLVATWEDVWEDLPTQIRLEVEERTGAASADGSAASSLAAALFDSPDLPAEQRLVFELLRADEALQIDEIVERLEGKASSSEIFAALFELELAGKVRALPGKNYLKAF